MNRRDARDAAADDDHADGAADGAEQRDAKSARGAGDAAPAAPSPPRTLFRDFIDPVLDPLKQQLMPLRRQLQRLATELIAQGQDEVTITTLRERLLAHIHHGGGLEQIESAAVSKWRGAEGGEGAVEAR